MSTHSQAPRSTADAVAGMRAEAADLAETLWSARPDAELVGVVEEIARLRAALTAVEAGVVVEVEARQLSKTRLGFGSTGDWLDHVGGLRRGQGERVLTRATALIGPLARTCRGLVAGLVSPEQAVVIVDPLEALPSGDLVRARGEKVMVTDARSLNATDLARVGRHLVEILDPDRADRRLQAQLDREDRAAHTHRFLTVGEDRAGGVWVKGRGTVEDAAVLRAALTPLTCPTPSLDPDTGELVPDPRESGARLWDALITTAQHALDTDLPPATHGARPRLVVTLDHHVLKAGLLQTHGDAASRLRSGLGVTGDGAELPPAVIRRLACDADLIPVVLGTASEVLDVGRAHRLVTTPIWTALVTRDHTAPFPPALVHP